MFFFRRRSRKITDQEKEKTIQSIRKDTFKKIDAASHATKELNELLDKDDSITQLIFMATGGDRRKNGNK